MTTTETFRQCDTNELLRQIGKMNLMAISGFRVIHRDTGVTLPVGAGYSVTIDLNGLDYYTVRRVFKRGAKVWIKGERDDIDFTQVGETAYQASCFRNGAWGD